MKKMMVLLKRRPGMTTEEFREHYENKHAVLGARYFEGLLVDFRRYYPITLTPFPPDWRQLSSESGPGPEYDAISVYTFRDENALAEYMRKMRDPQIGGVLLEDEMKFLDRPACRVGFCEALEGEGIASH